jgi:hypothetical protein
MRHTCTPIRAPEPDAALTGSRVAMPERSSAAGRLDSAEAIVHSGHGDPLAAGRLAEFPSSASPRAPRRLNVLGLIAYQLCGNCKPPRTSCGGTQ